MLDQRVSHYRILEQIGAGGMGVVYLARDEQLSRNVALKFIAPAATDDAQARSRLLREARSASAVDHPNVATVYEVGEWEGQLFLAMAYYPGETLKQRIARGPLAIDEAAGIAEQIGRGLAAAHAAGIVHRDLKPGNILLTSSGLVKLLDFGLAKLVGPAVETATDMTGAGVAVGTVSYMAPEQARGGTVDARADVWAFGVVLFEMLTRRLPFRHDSAVAALTSIQVDSPPAPRSIRPEIPRALESLVERALIKEPAERSLTAEEAARAIADHRSPAGRPGSTSRHWGRWGALALVLVALSLAVPSSVRAWNRRWATGTALGEVRRLADAQEMSAALELASKAENYIAGDTRLVELLRTISRPLAIESEPAGAEISYREYGKDGPWRTIGRTPLPALRLPVGWLQVKASLTGFEPAEDVAGNLAGPGAVGTMRFELVPAGSVPAGMLRATASAAPFSIYVLGLELPGVNVASFWIDRQEVTNRQFQEFVEADGYGRREFWQQPFAIEGRELSWDEARAKLVDATGRPGPAGWELGRYPQGQDDLPVTGVSWYEAEAYAAFAGRSLPTVYHWSWVAAQPLAGWVIPRATFQARSPVPANTSSALHRFGAVNLAGNVKEWCWNESPGGKRYILGGGFDEPPYMFSDADARSPFARSPNFGFRTMKLDPGDRSADSLGGPIVGPSRDYATERPADDAIFAAYARAYSYDTAEITAEVTPQESSSPDWRVELATFPAAYPDDRVQLYLFLPSRGKPPYQTIVFMPAANAWDLRTSEALRANPSFAYLMRSGRAVAFPIYKGTFERGTDDFRSDHKKNTSRWRDHVIALSQDLRRSIDYLATREDVDLEQLGYVGISRGAALSPMMLALEPRIRAAALWIPGLYLEPVPAEADAIHFITRVNVPVLVLSGKYDYNFPDERSSKAFFDRLGTPVKDKRRVVYDTGHNLPYAGAVKETLDWFDRYLGVVR